MQKEKKTTLFLNAARMRVLVRSGNPGPAGPNTFLNISTQQSNARGVQILTKFNPDILRVRNSSNQLSRCPRVHRWVPSGSRNETRSRSAGSVRLELREPRTRSGRFRTEKSKTCRFREIPQIVGHVVSNGSPPVESRKRGGRTRRTGAASRKTRNNTDQRPGRHR